MPIQPPRPNQSRFNAPYSSGKLEQSISPSGNSASTPVADDQLLRLVAPLPTTLIACAGAGEGAGVSGAGAALLEVATAGSWVAWAAGVLAT